MAYQPYKVFRLTTSSGNIVIRSEEDSVTSGILTVSQIPVEVQKEIYRHTSLTLRHIADRALDIKLPTWGETHSWMLSTAKPLFKESPNYG
jgi:hypothetical protein